MYREAPPLADLTPAQLEEWKAYTAALYEEHYGPLKIDVGREEAPVDMDSTCCPAMQYSLVGSNEWLCPRCGKVLGKEGARLPGKCGGCGQKIVEMKKGRNDR